jgi:hypothetical protein
MYITDSADAVASETVTVADTAIGFTESKYKSEPPVKKVFLSNAAGQIRFWFDGTAPEATVGHLMEIGDSMELNGYANIKNFRAIRTGSTSGVLSATFQN